MRSSSASTKDRGACSVLDNCDQASRFNALRVSQNAGRPALTVESRIKTRMLSTSWAELLRWLGKVHIVIEIKVQQ